MRVDWTFIGVTFLVMKIGPSREKRIKQAKDNEIASRVQLTELKKEDCVLNWLDQQHILWHLVLT